MCNSRACQCENKQKHCLQLSIQIRQPYQCICVPDAQQTNVQTSDVVAGLLKYNSNLTKYLHKYQNKSQPSHQQQVADPYIGEVKDKDKSIVQIYNLKVLPPGAYQQKPKQQEKQQQPQQSKPQTVDIEQQTSPRNENNKKKQPTKPKFPPGSNEDKIQKHMDDMAKSSRYLPNTGFKKYFGRECFQNYGRENTTGVADGIVYGNYLKTFNIAPHSGTNIPITEQTYRQTLITGDNTKYDNKKIPQTHYGNTVDREAAQGYHKKPLSNMKTVIDESQKHHKNKQKYTVKINEVVKNQKQIKSNGNGNGLNIIKKQQNSEKKLQVPLRVYEQNKKKPQQKQTQVIRQRQEQEEDTQKIGDISQIKPRIIPQPYKTKQDIRYPQSNSNTTNQVYERWDSSPQYKCRMQKKKQIIEECYKNEQVAQTIHRFQKPSCCLCQDRRYTKCCCA